MIFCLCVLLFAVVGLWFFYFKLEKKHNSLVKEYKNACRHDRIKVSVISKGNFLLKCADCASVWGSKTENIIHVDFKRGDF